ncbi:hypothetical protein AB0B31_29065 [Catellatospora citrea]|uniref:SCO6745 family protein n=1 Tax=Catellatospora citrea TaxID=53366 RepID=UPI0033EEE701
MQTAAMAADAVNRLGGAFLECPRTLRRARELGLTGWACYVAGRGGALGDVRPDTVAAALGLITPEAVRDGWDAARRALSPREVAAHLLAECCRWGSEHLDDAPKVDRLVELTEKAVLAADGAGLPLFAAWRAMPVPGDGPGARAAVALHLLREHRAGALLLGVRSSGLSPMEALIAGPEGEAAAVAFGWQPPYPPVAPLLRRRAWADAVADRISGQAVQNFTPAERGEWITILKDTTRTVFTRRR